VCAVRTISGCRCPLWVISGHWAVPARCPLYRGNRTWGEHGRAAPSSAIRTSFSIISGLCFRETGFCAAEIAASKRPVTFNGSSAETKSPCENPPIRRCLHDTGKSLFVWDCVVADAVTVEPVSATKFPASRENAGNCCEFQQDQADKCTVKPMMLLGIFAEFPTQSCRELKCQI
jgi:hypothetical protein